MPRPQTLCPQCSNPMQQVTVGWLSSGPSPEGAFRCGRCGKTWIMFSIPNRDPLLLCLDDKPADMHTGYWIKQEIKKREAT